LSDLPDVAVENSVTQIAEEGGDRMPAWSVVLKTARSIADHLREAMPALPASDTLSDDEHRHAMFMLRARETPEQRRRADRMTSETKDLPMPRRIVLAGELLGGKGIGQLAAALWDRLFDERLAAERAKLLPV
jgi:hypothetical protein